MFQYPTLGSFLWKRGCWQPAELAAFCFSILPSDRSYGRQPGQRDGRGPAAVSVSYPRIVPMEAPPAAPPATRHHAVSVSYPRIVPMEALRLARSPQRAPRCFSILPSDRSYGSPYEPHPAPLFVKVSVSYPRIVPMEEHLPWLQDVVELPVSVSYPRIVPMEAADCSGGD